MKRAEGAPHLCPRLGHCVGRAPPPVRERETETIKKQIQEVSYSAGLEKQARLSDLAALPLAA